MYGNKQFVVSLFTARTKNINKRVTKCLYFSVIILYNKVIRKDGHFPFAEGVSVNTDNKSAEKLNTSTSERPDISYGGCRYRLSYDNYENPCRRRRSVRASSVFLTVGIVAVFVAVGFFILRYYNRNIRSYYEKTAPDDPVAANFQSFLPPDTGD